MGLSHFGQVSGWYLVNESPLMRRLFVRVCLYRRNLVKVLARQCIPRYGWSMNSNRTRGLGIDVQRGVSTGQDPFLRFPRSLGAQSIWHAHDDTRRVAS